jgi:phage/plasmid-associated DNA primase
MLLLLEHASANFSIKTIPMPSDVKESTQDYMNENNHIKPWLESNIVLSKSDKDRIKADELYRDYKMFDEGEGATKVSNVVFAREMDFNNIEKKKISGVQYYLRIKFAENNTETKCDIQDLKEKDL